VIHNAAKYGCTGLSYDIHAFINAVYSDFSCRTTRIRELKEGFEFFNMEYATLIKDVPTHWLSLFKAIERLLA
jgi:hypothetical protein